MATTLRAKHDRSTEPETAPEPTAEELLELFGDEYTRRVFDAVADQPRCGRAVAEVADVSRATAYRRLNDLQDAGLVTSENQLATDGHHREQFVATVSRVSISLGSGGSEATVAHSR